MTIQSAVPSAVTSLCDQQDALGLTQQTYLHIDEGGLRGQPRPLRVVLGRRRPLGRPLAARSLLVGHGALRGAQLGLGEEPVRREQPLRGAREEPVRRAAGTKRGHSAVSPARPGPGQLCTASPRQPRQTRSRHLCTQTSQRFQQPFRSPGPFSLSVRESKCSSSLYYQIGGIPYGFSFELSGIWNFCMQSYSV